VILNTHHLAAQIEKFIRTQIKYWPIEIETRFEPQILNTGGAINNTRDFWRSDPFVVINSDILTDIDLQKAVDFHQNHPGPVTLILHDHPEFNNILVDRQGRIRELRQRKESGLAFTGIHILDREIFNFLPASGSYDIIPIYQQMIKEGIPVWAFISQNHYWRDIGTPESYLKIHEELLSGDSNLENSIPFSPPFNEGGLEGILIHPEARIEKGVEFSGWACIGKGCLLKKRCRIHNCVLWEGVTVESGASVTESILGQGVHLKDDLHGGVMI
jgi:NDP-sugar pyrophosphorylase family protein